MVGKVRHPMREIEFYRQEFNIKIDFIDRNLTLKFYRQEFNIKIDPCHGILGYNVSEFCWVVFGEEDFQRFCIKLSKLFYFKDNKRGTTIWTNFNYTFPRTIFAQYLRILFSSFGEEDFQRFCIKLSR